ncbi:MAG: lipopolysaccharide biosynthesis protein [Rudanella sp.]|nr:lipopolysaccharide biosynthesis protein [Rudanella sp.]
MNIEVFLRVLKRHIGWFILLPALTAGMAFYTTQDEIKVYRSQASLYTGLSSGYSITSDLRASYGDQSASAFDNMLSTLNAKETMLRAGSYLLADHLQLTEPDTLVLGRAGFDALQTAVPTDWRFMLPINGNVVVLRRAIDSLTKVPTDNPIKRLLLKSESPYSVAVITDKLKAIARKNTNDVMLLEYEANDPAVAQRTLNHAIAVLNERYSTLKTSETNSVVSYYEGQLQRAKQSLDKAEGNLQAFSVQHRVLDYDEEARNVAASREALLNEYNEEQMRRNAAKASMDALKSRMGQQVTIKKVNNDLSEKQRRLAQAEGQLANARAYNQPKGEISRLQVKVKQAEEELRGSVQRYETATTTDESVPQQTVSTDLLAKTLEYEESSARLELYQKRIAELETKTNEFSPMGSQLRSLKRDLSIAEKEYFDLLQHVDQSRTKRQDVRGGKLEPLDAPDYPLLPQPSKRLQLIIIGFGVGLFLALLLVALRFWLDKTIKTPEQAEIQIGLPMTAIFPTVKKPLVYSRVTRTARTMFEQLFNAINIEVAQTTGKPYPPVVTIFSVRARQGKTWVAEGLNRLYTDADQRVAYCYPRQTPKEYRVYKNGVTYFPYTVRPDFMNVTSLEYLIDHDHEFDSSQFDRVVLELPSLINNQIPVYLMKESAVSLLVVDATTAWARAEKQLLSLYARVTNQPMLAVLNRVGGDQLQIPARADAKQEPVYRDHSLQTQRE